jgi:FixJ family two-component response regulator
MNANNMTVFIVDDDPAVRDALSLMLGQANLVVKGFDNAREFLDFYGPDMPGCAIVDINMPDMTGTQLQEELIARHIPLPIIFLTGHGDIPLSVKTIKAGASDFLTKPVSCEKLLTSIQAALLECENLLVHKMINQRCQALLAALTQREQDVMMLVLDGQTNKKIAQHLGISHRTVEIHKARVMQKTGAENLLDLVRIVHEAGLPIRHGLRNDGHQR